MATKNTKSLGKEYWDCAAKQFVWPINHEHRHIIVPEAELKIAEDDLMVTHFRANGWHIQSVIGEVDKKKVFSTDGLTSGKPIFKPLKENTTVEPVFKLNDKFKIKSTECELKVCYFDKQKMHLQYTNRLNKPNIITSEEHLQRALKMGTWVRVV